jgi:hypothetical protein
MKRRAFIMISRRRGGDVAARGARTAGPQPVFYGMMGRII